MISASTIDFSNADLLILQSYGWVGEFLTLRQITLEIYLAMNLVGTGNEIEGECP